MKNSLKYLAIVLLIALAILFAIFIISGQAMIKTDINTAKNIEINIKEDEVFKQYIFPRKNINTIGELTRYHFYPVEDKKSFDYEYLKNEVYLQFNLMLIDILYGDFDEARENMVSFSPLINEETKESTKYYRDLIEKGYKLYWEADDINIIKYGFTNQVESIEPSKAEVLIFEANVKQKANDTEYNTKEIGLMIKENNQWKFYGYLADSNL